MSSLILSLSMVAMLQSPPDIKYKKLVHVVDGDGAIRTIPLPHNGNVDSRYVHAVDQNSPYDDDEIIYEALNNCKYTSRRRHESLERYQERLAKDEVLLRKLLEIEKSYNVPNSLRGILLAAACHESGYNPKALGDRKFSKNKRKPMAHGLFQMWPWWERAYKIDRMDPMQSAHAYMKHVVRQTKKVRKKCGRYYSKSDRRRWVVGWVTAIRAPKATGRCKERPRFYRIVRQWHRNIKAYRKQIEECANNGIDGCGC